MNRHRSAPLLAAAAAVAVTALVATGPLAAARGGPGAGAGATFRQIRPGTQGCVELFLRVEVTRAPGAATAVVDVAFGTGDECRRPARSRRPGTGR